MGFTSRGVDRLLAMMRGPCCTLRCNVRRLARLKRSGSASCTRPSNTTAMAFGSSCNQDRASHHTPLKRVWPSAPGAGRSHPPIA